MPGVNTTIDARAALRSVIKARYGRTISPTMWSSMKPSDPPAKGLGSADADDWQITLERASAKMIAMGYVIAGTTRVEADDARGGTLDASVALLVGKASSTERSGRRRRNRRNLALYLGGALTLFGIGLAAARRLGRKADR